LLFFAVATISSRTLQSQSLPLVNGNRVIGHLKAMGKIGKDPAGGISEDKGVLSFERVYNFDRPF
jgi:hypothetical protein